MTITPTRHNSNTSATMACCQDVSTSAADPIRFANAVPERVNGAHLGIPRLRQLHLHGGDVGLQFASPLGCRLGCRDVGQIGCRGCLVHFALTAVRAALVALCVLLLVAVSAARLAALTASSSAGREPAQIG